MKKLELDYIGKLTLKSVRDFVMDKTLTDKDTVLLNQKNLDEIALEHRETYKESLKLPYIIFGSVLVEDDSRVPPDRIAFIKDDPRRPYQIGNAEDYKQSLENNEEIVYRCGYCGSLVGESGEDLDAATFNHKRELLGAQRGHGYTSRVTCNSCFDKIRQSNAEKQDPDTTAK